LNFSAKEGNSAYHSAQLSPAVRTATAPIGRWAPQLDVSRGQALAFICTTTAVVALGVVSLRTVNRAGALALLAQTVLIFWILYRIERTAQRRKESSER